MNKWVINLLSPERAEYYDILVEADKCIAEGNTVRFMNNNADSTPTLVAYYTDVVSVTKE